MTCSLSCACRATTVDGQLIVLMAAAPAHARVQTRGGECVDELYAATDRVGALACVLASVGVTLLVSVAFMQLA